MKRSTDLDVRLRDLYHDGVEAELPPGFWDTWPETLPRRPARGIRRVVGPAIATLAVAVLVVGLAWWAVGAQVPPAPTGNHGGTTAGEATTSAASTATAPPAPTSVSSSTTVATGGPPNSRSAQHVPTERPAPSPPDGIPGTVDAEPVLIGSAIAAHVAAATDATPFLVGGSLGWILADCFAPDDFPTTPLIVRCNDGTVLYPGEAAARASTGAVRVVLEAAPPSRHGLRWPGSGPIVLQVHVHDPRAVACPGAYREACERAIVVDELAWAPPESQLPTPAPTPTPSPVDGAWPDGIPAGVAGEAVLRGDALRAHLDEVPDDTSFLVGGSAGSGLDRCTDGPVIPDPFFKSCADEPDFLDHDPGGSPDVLFIDHGEIEPPEGLIVLRVHIHDPHAADCARSLREQCDRAIVLEQVVWRQKP